MSDHSDESVFSEESATQPNTEVNDQEGEGQSGVKEESPASSKEPSQQPSASSEDLWADQLKSIKNERGEIKYKDVPTALDALRNSQEYIPTLKQENDTLRETVERLQKQVQEQRTLEESLEQLTSNQRQTEAPQVPNGLTTEEVNRLLDQRLQEREAASLAQSNLKSVSDGLRAQFGDKAKEVMQSKCEEYGMTVDEMKSLASRNPRAVSALFGTNSKTNVKTITSSVNIPSSRPSEPEPLAKPEKSLLSGAKGKDVTDYMSEIRKRVYSEHGITE